MPIENSRPIRIKGTDYHRARELRRLTGLSNVDAIGVALEGFDKLPAKVRGKLIQSRRERVFRNDRRTAEVQLKFCFAGRKRP